MTEWFYGKEGQQYGPIDEATLRARAATGEIGPDDMVWRDGMAQWQPMKDVPELAASSPPVVPPGSPGDQGLPPPIPDSPYASPNSQPGGALYQPAPGMPVTNGLAIASLVCGILSLVFFCLFGGILFGLPAVICGHLGMNQMNRPENQQQGRGLAIAGLVCGYCGLAIFVVIFFLGNLNFSMNDYVEP